MKSIFVFLLLLANSTISFSQKIAKTNKPDTLWLVSTPQEKIFHIPVAEKARDSVHFGIKELRWLTNQAKKNSDSLMKYVKYMAHTTGIVSMHWHEVGNEIEYYSETLKSELYFIDQATKQLYQKNKNTR